MLAGKPAAGSAKKIAEIMGFMPTEKRITRQSAREDEEEERRRLAKEKKIGKKKQRK